MNEHILIEKATRYPEPKAIEKPSGYSFQDKKGYWTNDTTGEPLMTNSDAKPPKSKKWDRETGEDQKGE